MPDDDRLMRRLEALGRSERGQLTQERLASIEAKATVAITLADPSTVTTSRLRRSAPIVLAVAALLVLFVVAAAWFTGGTALTVQAAEGSVVIEFPDGRSLDASVGLDVPDGSFVDVGEGGSVRLGDDELGPGRYVVRDGRAVPDPTATDRPRPPPRPHHATTATPRSAIDGDRDPADRRRLPLPHRSRRLGRARRCPPIGLRRPRRRATARPAPRLTSAPRRRWIAERPRPRWAMAPSRPRPRPIDHDHDRPNHDDRPSSTTTTMQPRTTTTSSSIPADRLARRNRTGEPIGFPEHAKLARCVRSR